MSNDSYIDWEDKLTCDIEENLEVTRSDAQSWVEVNIDRIVGSWRAGISPTDTYWAVFFTKQSESKMADNRKPIQIKMLPNVVNKP